MIFLQRQVIENLVAADAVAAVPSEMPLILMPPRRYPSAAMTKHANKGVSMEFRTLPKYIFSSVPKIGT